MSNAVPIPKFSSGARVKSLKNAAWNEQNKALGMGTITGRARLVRSRIYYFVMFLGSNRLIVMVETDLEASK